MLIPLFIRVLRWLFSDQAGRRPAVFGLGSAFVSGTRPSPSLLNPKRPPRCLPGAVGPLAASKLPRTGLLSSRAKPSRAAAVLDRGPGLGCAEVAKGPEAPEETTPLLPRCRGPAGGEPRRVGQCLTPRSCVVAPAQFVEQHPSQAPLPRSAKWGGFTGVLHSPGPGRPRGRAPRAGRRAGSKLSLRLRVARKHQVDARGRACEAAGVDLVLDHESPAGGERTGKQRRRRWA